MWDRRQTVVGSLFISGGHSMISTSSPQRDGIRARSGRALKVGLTVDGILGWDCRKAHCIVYMCIVYIWRTQHDFYKFTSARRDRSTFWEGIKGTWDPGTGP